MSPDAQLLSLFLDAAGGRFPPVDGEVSWLGPLRSGLEVIVSFTGHAVIASALGPAEFRDLAVDGFGGASQSGVLGRLTGSNGVEGVHDVTLVGWGTGRQHDRLPEVAHHEDHHRVRYARSQRANVTVYGDDRGLVTLSEGLAGRPEMSIEVDADRHGQALGRSLINDTLAMVASETPLFAAVSPGNARSLRAFLACGFTPVGSEVIIRPGR